jgi:hypothetical protein
MAKVIETDVVTVDSVFAHVSEAILVAKPDARVIDANPAASLLSVEKKTLERIAGGASLTDSERI